MPFENVSFSIKNKIKPNNDVFYNTRLKQIIPDMHRTVAWHDITDLNFLS
jgi:hypothetical protein